jgi:hypothetical protein
MKNINAKTALDLSKLNISGGGTFFHTSNKHYRSPPRIGADVTVPPS